MNLEPNSKIDQVYLPPQICMTSTSEVYLVLSTATSATTELRKDIQLPSKQCATKVENVQLLCSSTAYVALELDLSVSVKCLCHILCCSHHQIPHSDSAYCRLASEHPLGKARRGVQILLPQKLQVAVVQLEQLQTRQRHWAWPNATSLYCF